MIRIANGQGFWGDSVDAPVQLVEGGALDYLGLDYLAEVTLSIMMRQKLKNPALGYATDFVELARRILPACAERNIKVVTNAGGLNPAGLAEQVLAEARKLGLSGLKVAAVTGDDLLPRLDELAAAGHDLDHMDTGEPLERVRAQVLSANAYLGAWPLVEALASGATIVLSGRATDTALALAPMAHEFGWGVEDWDKLAAGTIAGHIIECGPQCTGGNFTRWREVPDLWNVGYPVIEAESDGSFVVTKHPGTGGLVTIDTVAEQLLYEMGDPRRYITPDVCADFTSIRLTQDGENRVRATGIRGSARTPTLKVSASYLNGFKASGQLTVSGPDAIAKAELCAEMVWKRLARAGVSFRREDRSVEMLGVSSCHPGIRPLPSDPPEVVLRLGVRDADRGKVERFGKEIAPLVTSGPPGVTGFSGGRPKPQEIVAYWPALIDRRAVEPQVRVQVFEA